MTAKRRKAEKLLVKAARDIIPLPESLKKFVAGRIGKIERKLAVAFSKGKTESLQ